MRERDILELLAAGNTNAVIAETLALSEKTIRNNITNIFASSTSPTGPRRSSGPGRRVWGT